MNWIENQINKIKGLFGIKEKEERSKLGSLNLKSPDGWLDLYLAGYPVDSGANVSETTSVYYIAYWSSIKVIFETLAMLPIILYKRVDSGKERAIESSLYNKMHIMPNKYQSAYDWKQLLGLHYIHYGNAYAHIITNKGGEIEELIPLMPWNMTVKLVQGERVYVYDVDGKKTVYSNNQILHIMNNSMDGVIGLSPIMQAKQSIGLGLSTEEYGARFYKNDARPGGVLEVPGRLSQEAIQRMRSSWSQAHQRMKDKHSVAILEENVKYKAIEIPPDTAQFLETRKYQTNEMARFNRVPPHMIGDLERATFSNIEQQSLEFIQYTMQPHLSRWEQALTTQLLTEKERETMFFEFKTDAILRGDIESRYKAYRIGREIGVLSPDDVRGMENLNSIENGNTYNQPANWINLGESVVNEGQGNTTTRSAKNEVKERYNLTLVYRELFKREIERLTVFEVNQIKRLIKNTLKPKGIVAYREDIDEFYSKFRQKYKREIAPTMRSLDKLVKGTIQNIDLQEDADIRQAEFVDSVISEAANDHIRRSKYDLTIINNKLEDESFDSEKAYNDLFKNWEEKQNVRRARALSTSSVNKLARNIMILGGVSTIMWVNTGSKTCPYCSELDGKTVNIYEPFISGGDNVIAEEGSMRVSNDKFGPPIHGGCDCQIVAV